MRQGYHIQDSLPQPFCFAKILWLCSPILRCIFTCSNASQLLVSVTPYSWTILLAFYITLFFFLALMANSIDSSGVLAIISSAPTAPANAHDAVALALHAAMLELNFKTIGTVELDEKSEIKGVSFSGRSVCLT